MIAVVPRWKRLALAAFIDLYAAEFPGAPHTEVAIGLLRLACSSVPLAPLNRAMGERTTCPFSAWWSLFEDSDAPDDPRIWADVAKRMT